MLTLKLNNMVLHLYTDARQSFDAVAKHDKTGLISG